MIHCGAPKYARAKKGIAIMMHNKFTKAIVKYDYDIYIYMKELLGQIENS